MERRQRGVSATEKYRRLTEQPMQRRARPRGFLALTSTTKGNKRMEFVNRHITAAISMRRCALLKTRSADLKRSNLVR